jgi:hypothetical protein
MNWWSSGQGSTNFGTCEHSAKASMYKKERFELFVYTIYHRVTIINKNIIFFCLLNNWSNIDQKKNWSNKIN